MGKFYIVASPIGNLEDITIRALALLKSVDLIISEDTRETTKLLNRYDIQKSQISYRDQNHDKVVQKIVDLLESGSDIALISDSGTPLISDPGFKLVQQLIKRGIGLISIPGPSAPISALVVSGLPTDKFAFIGFLPKKKTKRHNILKKYGQFDATLTIFESPYRIEQLISDIYEILGDRAICIVNEQTKKFERIHRGYAQTFVNGEQSIKTKGEFVVLVAKEGFKYE